MRKILLASLFIFGCRHIDDVPDATTCDVTFTDTGSVRLFVIGHHLSLDDAESYDAFRVSFQRDLARVAPCRSATRPNLVAFPEDAGLAAWFIGRRAMFARGARSVGSAMNAMYAGYYRAVDAYRARFPGISVPRGLTLALGDTAWRAMEFTFGALAKRYGVWITTSANLPYATRSHDGDTVALLGDPDVDASEGAFVADGPDCFNAALLYDPTGALVARTDKVFLTDTEEKTLDLSAGRLDNLAPWVTPFGNVGAAISRDAFYAPYMQRLEDLGTELVIQHEASQSWIGDGNEWRPEVFLASGWSHTQKYGGLRFSAAPMLNGNLFDVLFDGQIWIAHKAAPTDTLGGFIGNPLLPGFLAVGPWTFEDSGAALALSDRRATLRSLGTRLSPGGSAAGSQIASHLGADLTLTGETHAAAAKPVIGSLARPLSPTPQGNQTNVVAAYDNVGRLYSAWTDARAGTPQTFFAYSDDDGHSWSAARALDASSAAQRRPTIAAGNAGAVIVAWQETHQAEEIRVFASRDGGVHFLSSQVEPVGSAQWEPSVALSTNGLAAMAWTDFREGRAPKIRFSTSSDGVTWSTSQRLDTSIGETTKSTGMQVQPALIRTPAGFAAAWLDYRARDWQVWAAVGTGKTFGSAENITPPSATEILASDPRLAVSPEGAVMVAWDDLRARRGHHDVRAAVHSPAGGWIPVALLEGGADDGTFVSRFRPDAAYLGARFRMVFSDLTPGKSAIYAATVVPGDLSKVTMTRFDDTATAANVMTRPRVAVRADSARGVVVFEDDREGWRRIYSMELR